MISIMALRAVLMAALAAVQGLSVVSAGDRTHVLIEVDGAVTYDHDALSGPPRIVVDISGADFDLPRQRFLDINRGGVLALRSSQFQAGVVRVVVDLARSVEYEVDEVAGMLRISFPNPGDPFETWASSSSARTARAPAAEQNPLGQPVRDAPRQAEPRQSQPAPEPVRRAPQQPDRAAVEVPVSRPAVVEAPPQQEQPRIWVEFRNTPIVDVLGTFADFSGRSIIPGQGVGQQTITATIQGQPWDEAMRAILRGQGLAAAELPSGIIMVTSLQEQRQFEEQEEVITRSFPLRFASADSVAPQVRTLIGQEGRNGTVAINRATNAVMVSARQSVVDQVAALMGALDQRVPQVTVKVRILTVRRSQFEGLGIHYELRDRGADDGAVAVTQLGGLAPGGLDQVSITGSSVAALGNAAASIPGATFDVLTSLVLGRHTLITWIEALESLELAELQADPTVTVLNNHTARVHVGQRTPIRVVDQGAASAQGPQAQVQTEETGVILELTPHVVGDQVRLQLHAERSELLSQPGDEAYTFGTSETDTEILLDNAETAVISGLTTADVLEFRSGIPILMNLPVIGALFRNTRKEITKEDLLIMVTPYIHEPGAL